MRSIAIPVFIALALSGAVVVYGAQLDDAVTPTRATPTAEVQSPAPTASEFRDCGDEVRSLPRDRDLASRDCLRAAHEAGVAARWSTTMPTIEGDPIKFVITTSGTGAIEVQVDNTADRFAAPEDRTFKSFTCATLDIEPAAIPPTFELGGCEGQPGDLRI